MNPNQGSRASVYSSNEHLCIYGQTAGVISHVRQAHSADGSWFVLSDRLRSGAPLSTRSLPRFRML
jgi:hypothetical protein